MFGAMSNTSHSVDGVLRPPAPGRRVVSICWMIGRCFGLVAALMIDDARRKMASMAQFFFSEDSMCSIEQIG